MITDFWIPQSNHKYTCNFSINDVILHVHAVMYNVYNKHCAINVCIIQCMYIVHTCIYSTSQCSI